MQSHPLAHSSSPSSAFQGRSPAYDQHYLAAQPVPYTFVEASGARSSAGGVLKSGQSVWLDHVIQRKRLPGSTQAFVESLGLISVDPRWLKKAGGFC